MVNMRIGGLASGMDTDQIVKDLMKAERMPMEKLKQKKQTIEWQRDDYRSMNTLLLNFRTELTQMKLSTKYRARTTTSSDETKVTATATSAASQGSFSITKVDQLASAATKVATAPLSGTTKIDASKGLYEAQANFAAAASMDWKAGSVETQSINVAADGKSFAVQLSSGVKVVTAEAMNISVNGTAYKAVAVTDTATFDETTLAANQVAIDPNGKMKFRNNLTKDSTIKIDFVADKKVDTFKFSQATSEIQLTKGSIRTDSNLVIKFGSKTYTNNQADKTKLYDGTTLVGDIDLATGKIKLQTGNEIPPNTDVSAEYKQNYLSFNIAASTSKGDKSEYFMVQGSESLNNVISKVNASLVGVSMLYDSYSDKVTLTRTESGDYKAGAGNEITTAGNFLNSVLNLGSSVESGGKNAKFTINGLDTERNANTFEMNGVSFSLKKTFTTSDTPANISINNDSSKVFDNIKGFVEKYNELIGKIQGELNEDRYRSYTPLTDEQREGLSEKQQEQWEEKAKSGMLRKDPDLASVLSKMRQDFYGKVENDQLNPLYQQLTSIGIMTSGNYLQGGKLEINESELKKAIESDPASVEKLFNATGTTNSQMGIAQRLYKSVDDVMGKLREKAGNAFTTSNKQFHLGRQLDDIDNRLDRFEDRMKQVEDRYYRQFTAMEKAIQKSNQQSTYLMHQFSGGQ